MRIKVNRIRGALHAVFSVLLLSCMATQAIADDTPCTRTWTQHASYPREPDRFTQGLLVHRGRLYESLGLYGRSAVQEVELRSGRVLRMQALPARVFGEGLAVAGEQLVQLSWREQTAWRYDFDLALHATQPYPGEGWGLTTWRSPAGERLILSDGTPQLRVLHPDTLAEEGRVTVRVSGEPVKWLNELEMVGEELLANLWHSDAVAVIDPRSGAVHARFDFSALRRQLAWPRGRPRETDLNGLAWDAERERLLVTGKNWPLLFELSIGDCPAAAQ